MILTFNDGTEIIVDRASCADALTIRLHYGTPSELREMFSDDFKTRRMEISGDVYERYTVLDHITEFTSGAYEVVLYQDGETPDERIDHLAEEVDTEVTEIQEALVELYEMIIGG